MIIIERAGMAGHDQGRVLELALFCACDAHLLSVSPIHTRLIVGASSFNRPRLIAHRVHQTLDRPGFPLLAKLSMYSKWFRGLDS